MQRGATGIAVLASAVLAGCSAKLMSRPDPLAPAPEARLGLVQYEEGAIAPVMRRRQAAADRQMKESCGGAYKVESAQSQRGQPRVIPMNGIVLVMRPKMRYIVFSCVPRDSVPPG